MKNALFFFVLLLVSFQIQAQDNGRTSQRLSSFDYFVKETNIIAENRIPRDLKEMKLLDLIDRYQGWVKRDQLKDEMKEYDICLQDGSNCNREKVIEYVDQIHRIHNNRSAAAESRMIESLQDEDPDYIKAMEIYRKLGHARVGRKDLCYGNCDLQDQPKSRSKENTEWQYTGECRYFVTDKIVGWRFLCDKVSRVPDPNMDGKAEQAWKEEKNVDHW